MLNMRKKLIKLIHHCTSCEECRDEDIADHLIAEGIIARQWIPVSERLPHFYPERQRRVLVTIEDEKGKRFTSYARYDEEFKSWCGFTHSRFFDEDNHFKVVAWMEKPEPWRGER